MNLETISVLVDILYRLVAAAGIVVGGVWAYRIYVKERLHAERLDLTIDYAIRARSQARSQAGEAGEAGGALRVSVYCDVSNVGARRVELDRELSAVILLVKPLRHGRLGASGPRLRYGQDSRWQEVGWEPVFDELEAIEPGESAQDTAALEVPGSLANADGLRLQAYVYSRKFGKRWPAGKVVKEIPTVDNWGQR